MSSDESGPAELIVPFSLGMVSDPPTLILVYEVHQKGIDDEVRIRKRRKRKMPIRNFSDKSDIRKSLFILQQRHSKFLSPVPQVFLEKMLRIVQRVQGGLRIGEAVEAVDEEFGINGDEDLNKIQPEELQRKKELMNETFVKSLILPGDTGYVYDKEVTFTQVGGSGTRSAWDEEEDDAEPEEKDHLQEPLLRQFGGSDGDGEKVEHSVVPDPELFEENQEHSIHISTKLEILQEGSKVTAEAMEAPKEEKAEDEGGKEKETRKPAKVDFSLKSDVEDSKMANKDIDEFFRKIDSTSTETEKNEAGNEIRTGRSREEETSREFGDVVENGGKTPGDIIGDKAVPPTTTTREDEQDSEASIGNEEFESEEELPESHKELSKEYDFKLAEDPDVEEKEDPDDVLDDDFWKF